MLWVTQHLQHVRVSESSWRMHLSLSHQSDESYRRGVHINRQSSHSLSVIFIHNPNRISILTSEFPPLLKQVDLLSVVLLTWIFNPRVVYTRPGYHGYGYERLNTDTDFFTFWIDHLLFLQHVFIFAFLSTYHFRLSCDTVLKPRIFFSRRTVVNQKCEKFKPKHVFAIHFTANIKVRLFLRKLLFCYF